ncbi:heme oxygenase (staphylobilin-producing) [Paenibacillus phyllosphaerae]|uniref:Heme oxygenase (Staphylobilin-producing) n=1 Tax=Paenibacillus phyllosphaerae TaxID=274593 RepID=A0A7W5FPK5_9BACL|nr:heme oxygenase [Paenibacillus phyllosphaerae]MBB3112451.1 heme oxygenase (staphylobilin-producing) [Paenibacillus phyllosphaerae]
MTAIEANGLTLELGPFGLKDLSIAIPEGEMTAIVGPNGSGKSTLLRMISRLQKPDSGEVIIQGRDAGAYSTAQFAQTLTMLTQSKGQMPDLTVREFVAYGRSPYKRLFDRMSEEDHGIVNWALTLTGTIRHENRMFHTLSGGEQQKVRIAMALAQKTNILLLDEPTTYLDLAHQLDLMEMLQAINRDYKLTVVMVLHDLQQAAAYCDYMIAMQRGRVVHTGKPRELLTPRFLQEVYRIDAKVAFEDDYPVIIPIRSGAKPKEEPPMIIVTNTSQITKGEAHKLIERFDRVGKVEYMEGFLGLEVHLTENTKEYDEVSVVTKWRSKEDFQAWTRSDAFKESHAHRKTPEFIISNKISFYEVKIVREPAAVTGESSNAS